MRYWGGDQKIHLNGRGDGIDNVTSPHLDIYIVKLFDGHMF